MNKLKHILHARSIAVIGASTNTEKIGHIILKNLIEGGYRGALYPINKKEQSILGLKCYSDVTNIPNQIDLAVVCVPAQNVVSVVRAAGYMGAKGAIVVSGGFREIGKDSLESELCQTAKEYGMRIIGPNCQGINYLSNKMCATWPLITCNGMLGIVAQSGTIGAEMALLACRDGLGISCFAALGNKCDINEADFIEYFLEDPQTKVIALNLEGLQNVPAFTQALELARDKKPVVILKPGRTMRGAQAVSSHTRSVAGNDRIFSAYCRKHGVIRAETLVEFYDYCKAAAFLQKPKGSRLLIVTSSGGAGILAIDIAEICKLDTPPLHDELKDALSHRLPSQCVISNPLDLTGDATAERYEVALETIAQRSDFDAVLVIFGDPIQGASLVMDRIRTKLSIPIVVSYLGGGAIQDEEQHRIQHVSIPVFPTPERAVVALSSLCEHRN